MWVETVPYCLLVWTILLLSIKYHLFDVFAVSVVISIIIDYYRYYERAQRWTKSPRRFIRLAAGRHAIKRVLTFVLSTVFVIFSPIFKLFSNTQLDEWLFKLVMTKVGRHWASWAKAVRDNDDELKSNHVIVSTYSKSGTNLGLMLVESIVQRGNARFSHIHDVCPWPQHEPNAPGWSINLKETPRNRLVAVKTHSPLGMMNADTSQAKFIYICRDPKSVVLSSGPFFRGVGFGPFIPSLPSLVSLFLDGAMPDGPYPDHVNDAWLRRDLKNVLFLRYEEIVSQPDRVVDDVVKFLGVPPLSPAEKRGVVHQISFKYMKSIEDKFAIGGISPLGDGIGTLVRKGKTQADELTPAQRQQIDSLITARFAALGSTFPYTDYYCY